jgi:threonine aldolase
VVCAETSHLWRDECNAPERFLGAKLIPVPTADGKLDADAVRPFLQGFGVVHQAQPRVISVAQPTEWGTLYSVDELRRLSALAHEHGMVFHVDGARLANAAAALGLPLSAFGASAGVDLLSFGGTKLGLLAADAVVLFDPELAERTAYYRKQAMQLASKMRFIAAQFDAMLTDDLWRALAAHANAMAARLGAGLAQVPSLEVVRPVETNAVFARFPDALIEPLQQAAAFHVWDAADSVVRLMTAWDTEPERVDAFVAEAARLCERSADRDLP